MNDYPDRDDDVDFIEKVYQRYQECKDHTDDWRTESMQAYDFVAGDQWEDDDRTTLEEQLRPVTTFNRTEVFVSAVTGLEALNRQEVRYVPRKPGPISNATSDIWTDAAKYVNDDSDADVHHSTAFRDLVICGMGWTDTQMNYELNPEGDVDIQRFDPLYAYWDPSSNDRNLMDSRWRMRLIPMSYDEVIQRWPDAEEDLIYSRIFDPDYSQESPHHAYEAWKYENDQSRTEPSEGQEVWVCKYQYYELESFYRLKKPDGTTQDISARLWKKFKDKYPEASQIKVVGPLTKRQYKQKYLCGWTVLEETDLITQDFTMQCMTGKHDRNRNIWYGLLRTLIDPQTWLNKFFSQILFTINSNAKGGIMAERGAFENPSEAEDNWARADSITWVTEGAIRNQKVLPKPFAPYPQGMDRLMQFAMEMFVGSTGVNLELLGLAERDQPGVLEAQRKQAGMTILAWAFDAMRAYRRSHGRILADFIREFMADGRLIRVTGKEGEQFIPLIRDNLAMEYDIVVDESPQSTNEKERVFAVLTQLLPQLTQMGAAPPPDILDYFPLPAPLTQTWKKAIQDASQNPEAQQAKQLAMQQAIADIQKTLAEAGLKQAQAQTEPMKAIK